MPGNVGRFGGWEERGTNEVLKTGGKGAFLSFFRVDSLDLRILSIKAAHILVESSFRT